MTIEYLLRMLLSKVNSDERGKTSVPKVPAANDLAGLFSIFFKFSSRLAPLCAKVADQVVKMKEKAIIWTLYPVEQMVITAMLQALNVKAEPFVSWLNPTECAQLIDTFDNDMDNCTVLISNHQVSGVGLKLHKACWNVHLYDPAPSRDAQTQAVGRSYRLGQLHDVQVQGTFNERQINHQIMRSLPGLAATMDPKRFAEQFVVSLRCQWSASESNERYQRSASESNERYQRQQQRIGINKKSHLAAEHTLMSPDLGVKWGYSGPSSDTASVSSSSYVFLVFLRGRKAYDFSFERHHLSSSLLTSTAFETPLFKKFVLFSLRREISGKPPRPQV